MIFLETLVKAIITYWFLCQVNRKIENRLLIVPQPKGQGLTQRKSKYEQMKVVIAEAKENLKREQSTHLIELQYLKLENGKKV
jgi:uncharacterized protein YqhQ